MELNCASDLTLRLSYNVLGDGMVTDQAGLIGWPQGGRGGLS